MSQITAAELNYVKGLADDADPVAIALMSHKDELNSNIVQLFQDYRTRPAVAGVSTADLASTANGKGASMVGVEDAGGKYTATTVEAALAEVKTLADAARTSAYTPGTAGDWATSPTTIQAAIDRIAAAVAGLLTTPIP